MQLDLEGEAFSSYSWGDDGLSTMDYLGGMYEDEEASIQARAD